jgi:cytochrome c oxidase subunit II
MSAFIIVVLVALVFTIIYQIGKSSEYASIIRGKEFSELKTNRTLAWVLVGFFATGIYGIFVCNEYFKGKLLPVAACANGVKYDNMFMLTLAVTGIVFFATQFALFYFIFKYQTTAKRKSSFFFAHNTQLEIIWTTIPAIAMTVLIVIGLKNWFAATAPAGNDAMVVEVVGKQFNWVMRYPGKDKELGVRDFKKINDATNILGQDWSDPHNMDDVISNGELHLVVNKTTKLIIGSRDVIHDVGLPHFRIKMDAVPGIATYITLTPTITTDSMKTITGNPNFVYEIACDQLCGKGHYSMRGTIIVETQAQYDEWMSKQQTYYSLNNPQNTAKDTAATPKVEATVVEGKKTENMGEKIKKD